MNLIDALRGLQFDNDGIFHQQVHDILANQHAIVRDFNSSLLFDSGQYRVLES